MFEYKTKGQNLDHLYDCINDERYPIGKPFVFMEPVKFLSANIDMIEGDVALGTKVKEITVPASLIGNKKAKVKTEKAANGEGDS